MRRRLINVDLAPFGERRFNGNDPRAVRTPNATKAPFAQRRVVRIRKGQVVSQNIAQADVVAVDPNGDAFRVFELDRVIDESFSR